jgi:hypothetical protein
VKRSILIPVGGEEMLIGDEGDSNLALVEKVNVLLEEKEEKNKLIDKKKVEQIEVQLKVNNVLMKKKRKGKGRMRRKRILQLMRVEMVKKKKYSEKEV